MVKLFLAKVLARQLAAWLSTGQRLDCFGDFELAACLAVFVLTTGVCGWRSSAHRQHVDPTCFRASPL